MTNYIRIQQRHDTAANWTSNNPILLEGERGYESDTRLEKVGDGVTAWNSLGYTEAAAGVHGNESHDPDFASLDADSLVVEAVTKIRVCNPAPDSPAEGDTYVDSVENAMYVAVG